MVTDSRKIATLVTTHDKDVVEEAMRLLEQGRPTRTAVHRWVCEVCGMIHTGSDIEACDSCGKATALVRQPDFHIEMRSLY
jgi:rubrerythrin